MIINSGGIPVLAHPKSLNLSKKELLILIKNMIGFGLKGIEVIHSSHNEEDIKLYLDITNEFNLLISGGTDYHGGRKKDISLGIGEGNLEVPDSIISNWNNINC